MDSPLAIDIATAACVVVNLVGIPSKAPALLAALSIPNTRCKASILALPSSLNISIHHYTTPQQHARVDIDITPGMHRDDIPHIITEIQRGCNSALHPEEKRGACDKS
jgi:hypothetical protein